MTGKAFPDKKKFLFLFLVYSGCTLCLLLPALYNGYPLVTPDSGAYIGTGWELHVPIDRPITYSIFLRVTSLSGLSLWGVVWAQTFILVYFLRRICRKLLREHYNESIFCVTILLLGAFTSVGWFCSQLMPDIFTSILFLAIADFYLSPLSQKRDKVIYFLLIWFFMLQHNSHLLIVLLLCVLARFYYIFSKRKWFLRKTLLLFCITLFSFISVSFFNLWEGNRFRPSAGTHVFIMSRMAENGILDKFLKQYCPIEKYTLCNYQNNTGDRQWDFMWNDKGHLHDIGGWDKAQEEYNTIIFRTLTRPKYLILQIYESLEATLRQIPQVTVSVIPYGEGSSPYQNIERYCSREIKEYRTSLQQTGVLSGLTGYFNGLIFVFLIITGVFTFLFYDKNNKKPDQLNRNFFLVLIISGIILNAGITATFSTVIDRLQARIFWLLPFACMLYLAQKNAELKRNK